MNLAAAAELGATRAEQADRWTYRGFTFGALVESPWKQNPVLKVFVVTSSPLSFALRTETAGDHFAGILTEPAIFQFTHLRSACDLGDRRACFDAWW